MAVDGGLRRQYSPSIAGTWVSSFHRWGTEGVLQRGNHRKRPPNLCSAVLWVGFSHRPSSPDNCPQAGRWGDEMQRQASKINKYQTPPPRLVKGEGVYTPFLGFCPKLINLPEQDSVQCLPGSAAALSEAGSVPRFHLTWGGGGITPLISKPRISH